MNHLSIRIQTSSLPTASSMPCSMLGLSLTSMTTMPSVGLLEVDAVEAVADRLGGAHRDVDDLGRRLVEIEGAEPAFARRAVGTVLDDLPVAARHAVLADEQRLAGEHADAPVELGRHEFLREQQVGLLEQLVGDALELLAPLRPCGRRGRTSRRESSPPAAGQARPSRAAGRRRRPA